MISKDNTDKLIKIYFFISEKFHELQYYCERFSNNRNPDFTDQEIIAIYLYVMHHEGHTKIKHIHRFASEYLKDWFPKLGSYQAFNSRLNRLTWVFNKLVELIVTENIPDDSIFDQSLLDSMPIITCSGKRFRKVAKEITDKGFNSTKGMYYFGIKLHVLGFRRKGKLPHPESIVLTPASVNDITVYKQYWASCYYNKTFFGDKIYIDYKLNDEIKEKLNSEMLTPIKYAKGTLDVIKTRMKAADELFSSAVSKIRQPIEALFSWLIQKTDIQRANLVRSTKGLLIHTYGRLAAAFISLVF